MTVEVAGPQAMHGADETHAINESTVPGLT